MLTSWDSVLNTLILVIVMPTTCSLRKRRCCHEIYISRQQNDFSDQCSTFMLSIVLISGSWHAWTRPCVADLPRWGSRKATSHVAIFAIETFFVSASKIKLSRGLVQSYLSVDYVLLVSMWWKWLRDHCNASCNSPCEQDRCTSKPYSVVRLLQYATVPNQLPRAMPCPTLP